MKKKIISLILVLVFALSLVSCFKDDRRYDYEDMTKYVTLANYFDREIEIENKYVTQTIANYRKEYATTLYSAKEGDKIYVVLKYTAVEFLDEEETKVNEATKQLIEGLTFDGCIENLGAGSYNEAIEDIIIGMGVKITKTTEKIITLPNDAKFGEHAGKKVRFSCEFKDMECREGDVVKVNYVGYYTDDKGNIKLNDKNEKDSFDKGTGVRFFIGSGLAIEDFENGIIGMRLTGDTTKTKQITATFPDDYAQESFRNKKVIFEVTVLEINEVEEYNDKFVKDHLGFDTMAEFEDDLKKDYADESMKNILISESKFLDYPRREYREFKDQFEQIDANYKNYYGYSFEDYISVYYGMTKDEYIKTSMQLEMVYYAIAKAQGFAPVKGDAYLTQARKDLIEENKTAYMGRYPNTTEADAYEIAEEYVDKELGTAAIYEKAVYTFVEAHLKENITIKMVDEKTEDK